MTRRNGTAVVMRIVLVAALAAGMCLGLVRTGNAQSQTPESAVVYAYVPQADVLTDKTSYMTDELVDQGYNFENNYLADTDTTNNDTGPCTFEMLRGIITLGYNFIIHSHGGHVIKCRGSEPAPGDWPCFMGPNHNCSSDEKGFLREWPAGGPEVLWRVKIGQASSCPSVVGDEVYVVSCEDGPKEYTETVACLDTRTGKELWRYTYGTGKHLYLWDNVGNCIVFEPGREFKLVAVNRIENILPRRYALQPPKELIGYSQPVFDGKYIHIRGEENLYCIGEQ